MSTGKVKISQFPVTNSIQPGDLLAIVKKTGNNAYQNYVVDAGNVRVPHAVLADTASLVNYSNVVNKPSLISGSGQFTSSTDHPIFGQVTASNLEVLGTLATPNVVAGNLLVTQSQTIQHNLIVSGGFTVNGSSSFGGNVSASSISTNILTVKSSTILSGSNTFGDKSTTTQSLNGLVSVNGNIVVASGYKVIADSASFQTIAPLVSASISHISASSVSIDTILAVPTVTASVVSASVVNASTSSVGLSKVSGNASVAGALMVLGAIHGTADNSISSSFAGSASVALSLIGTATASYANTASFAQTASQATSASFASSSLSSLTSTTASYSPTASYINNKNYVTVASGANDQTTASYALRATSASYAAVTQVFSNSGSYVTTASNAKDQSTASYSNTASYAQTAGTASYALSSPAIGLNYVVTASGTSNNNTASYAQTASAFDPSKILTLPSASIGNLTGTASYASTAGTASYALNNSSVSSSYARSASHASLSDVATLAVTASSVVSASNYVLTNSTRQLVTAPNTFVSGNLLTLDSTGSIVLASAQNVSSSNVFGIVEYSDYIGSGSITGSMFSVVYYGHLRLSNLIAGATYYLSDVTPGGYSSTASANPFSVNQPVFTALSGFEALFYKVTPKVTQTQTSSYALTSSYNQDPVIRETYAVSNSFTAGQVISLTVAGNPQLALANTEQNANVAGVIERANATSFTVIFSGLVTNLISPLLPGYTYYLSDTIPGTLTTNRNGLQPSSVIKPVGFATSPSQLVLFNSFSTNSPLGNAQTAVTASYVGNANSSSYASVAGAALTILGSLPTNGNSIRDTYSSSNSFVAGNVIGFDKYTDTPTLCVADSVANSSVLGIVESANSSSFTVVYSGKLFLSSGSFPVTGALYYLSPTLSGSFQQTAPTAQGQVVKSLLYSIDHSTAVVSINGHQTTASAALSSSYAANASVANYSLLSNSASSATNANGLSQVGGIFPLVGFVTTGSATTSSVTYLNVNVNGTNYKLPLYGV